jgi:hypothetical protein
MSPARGIYKQAQLESQYLPASYANAGVLTHACTTMHVCSWCLPGYTPLRPMLGPNTRPTLPAGSSIDTANRDILAFTPMPTPCQSILPTGHPCIHTDANHPPPLSKAPGTHTIPSIDSSASPSHLSQHVQASEASGVVPQP